MNTLLKRMTVASAMTLVLGISACSENKTANEYLNDAKLSLEASNYGKAVVELKNAVKQSPKNAELRYLLGNTYMSQGRFINAEKELEKALDLGYDFKEVATSLALIKSKLNKKEDAYQLVERSDTLTDKNFAQVLTYAGISAYTANESEKGEDYLGQAIAILGDLSLAKAYFEATLKNDEQALDIITSLLKKAPENAELILFSGHLNFSLENYELASRDFEHYLSITPYDYSVMFLNVKSLIYANKLDQADEKVTKLLAKVKDSPLALQYKAQIEYSRKNFSEAKGYAEKSLNRDSSSLTAKMILGASSYYLDDIEQAYSSLILVERYLPAEHPLNRMLLVIKLRLGYVKQAAKSLDESSDLTAEDAEMLRLSSQELMEAGDFDTATRLIEKAEILDPNNAEVSAQKGYLLLSQGNDVGASWLEKALEQDPSLTDVELALAVEYMKKGQDKKAISIANKWIDSEDSKVSGYLLQGIIEVKQSKIETAKGSFKSALAIDEKNEVALYNLAILASNENKHSEAIGYYQQVLTINPDYEEALENLSQLQLSDDNVSDTIMFLSGLNKDNPESINVIIALARNLKANNELSKAITLLESIQAKSNLSESYWVMLADSYIENNQLELASKIIRKAGNDLPSDYFLRLRSIGLLAMSGDFPQALKATESALVEFPKNNRLLMLQAYYELKNNNPNATKAILLRLKDKKLNHAFLDTITGGLAMHEKRFSDAVESFNAAYEVDASDDNALYLSRALAFSGQQAEAESLLERHLVNNNSKYLRLMLAGLYKPENYLKAIKQYQEIVAKEPENIGALNNIAWLYYENGDFAKALPEIEKAYTLDPESLTILESYGVILYANKHNNALEILTRAINKGSKDEEVIKAQSALR